MRFNILGPLGIIDDAGEPVAVSRRLHRSMLAFLLLNAGQPCSAARLTAALWGDGPPRHPEESLRSCVYGVRKVLPEAGRLRTRRDGYLLHVRPRELDLTDFRDLAGQGRAVLDQGDPRGAADLLGQAVGLWREPALADLPAGRDKDRLLEQRTQARDALIDAKLALGGHRHVLEELRSLVAADPLREHAWAQLMLALYRSGARAEALAAFGQLRMTLVSGYGIEPGPELQDLHRQVLGDDPALMAGRYGGVLAAVASLTAWPPPGQVPAPVPDFTGRAGELARLGERLDRHDLSVTVLSGMPGAGKTALALQAAQLTRARFAAGQLFACLDDAGRARDPHDVLAELLRGLGVPARGVPAGRFEREALYRTALSRPVLAGRRVLVVADGARSAAQVRPLLPGTPDAAVIVTSRARLADLESSVRIELGGLLPADGVSLLATIAGREADGCHADAMRAIADACDGLPLALRIAGARLADDPCLAVAKLAELVADETRCLDELEVGQSSVRDRFAAAASAAWAAGRAERALALLSEAGPGGVTETAMAVVLDEPADQSAGLALARALVDAGLLTRVADSSQVRYLMHPLVRAYACQLLGQAPAGLAGSARGRLLAADWLELARSRSGKAVRPYP